MAAPIPKLELRLSPAGGDPLHGDVDTTEPDGSGEVPAQGGVVGAGDGTQARPGWYPDPAGQASYRWWGGTGWTTHID